MKRTILSNLTSQSKWIWIQCLISVKATTYLTSSQTLVAFRAFSFQHLPFLCLSGTITCSTTSWWVDFTNLSAKMKTHAMSKTLLESLTTWNPGSSTIQRSISGICYLLGSVFAKLVKLIDLRKALNRHDNTLLMKQTLSRSSNQEGTLTPHCDFSWTKSSALDLRNEAATWLLTQISKQRARKKERIRTSTRTAFTRVILTISSPMKRLSNSRHLSSSKTIRPHSTWLQTCIITIVRSKVWWIPRGEQIWLLPKPKSLNFARKFLTNLPQWTRTRSSIVYRMSKKMPQIFRDSRGKRSFHQEIALAT